MIEQRVRLEPISHVYTDKSGVEYKSVSKLLDLVKPKFDRENISKAVARKRGISQQEVLAEWDKKRDDASAHGTTVHNALETFEKTGKVADGYESEIPVMKSILSEYSEYKKIYQELCIYNEEHKIAGTADKVMLKSTHKDAPIFLADYKTNRERGVVYCNPYNKYLKYPLDHLQDCNFNLYALQLSIYGYMLEVLTSRRIGGMFIHYIPFDNPMAHQKIHVPYLKHDVMNLFSCYKELREDISYKIDLSPEITFEGEQAF